MHVVWAVVNGAALSSVHNTACNVFQVLLFVESAAHTRKVLVNTVDYSLTVVQSVVVFNYRDNSFPMFDFYLELVCPLVLAVI